MEEQDRPCLGSGSSLVLSWILREKHGFGLSASHSHDPFQELLTLPRELPGGDGRNGSGYKVQSSISLLPPFFINSESLKVSVIISVTVHTNMDLSPLNY